MQDCVRQLQRNAVLFVNLKQWVIGIFTSGNTENFHETTLVGHETTKKTTKKATKKTSNIQDEILNCLQKNPYATVKEVQMQFKSMSIDGIQYHIRRLKSMGLLKRIGPDKGGYWQVVDMQ